MISLRIKITADVPAVSRDASSGPVARDGWTGEAAFFCVCVWCGGRRWGCGVCHSDLGPADLFLGHRQVLRVLQPIAKRCRNAATSNRPCQYCPPALSITTDWGALKECFFCSPLTAAVGTLHRDCSCKPQLTCQPDRRDRPVNPRVEQPAVALQPAQRRAPLRLGRVRAGRDVPLVVRQPDLRPVLLRH